MVGGDGESNDNRTERTAYDATYMHPGGEISSTAEGRYVNIYEDLLIHPAHADGLVDKGDPVVVQQLVGIALKSAVSSDDVIVVETEGLWYLTVTAGTNGMGDIDVGMVLYIDYTTAAISNDSMGVPFGHALAQVLDGETEVIAVKVHAFQTLFPWWFFL